MAQRTTIRVLAAVTLPATLVAATLALVILAPVILTAACSAPVKPPTDAPAQAVTIAFRPADVSAAPRQNQGQMLRELIADFQGTHPQIAVELDLSTADREASIASLAEQVDCFAWPPPRWAAGDQEAIRNLTPFLEADLSLPSDDFYPSLLDQFTWQGQLWGLPSEAVPYVIKYNRALFDAAGVAYPASDWTTDDFLQTAIALTQGRDEDAQYGFVASPLEYQELLLLLDRRGARLVDTSVDPPTVRLNDPSTIQALYWYVSLSAEHGVKPVYMTDWAQVNDLEGVMSGWQAMIRDGRAAMWTDLESVDLFWAPPGIDLGVAPFPAGSGAAPRAAGAYQRVLGYYISARAEAPGACWAWIAYLTSHPEASRWLPTRRSVLLSDAYREQVGEERAMAYHVSLDGVDKPPSMQMQPEEQWMTVGILLWLTRAYGQAVEGEATVERALDDAQQTFDRYRACVIARGDVSDQQVWMTCVREADPTLPEGIFGS